MNKENLLKVCRAIRLLGFDKREKLDFEVFLLLLEAAEKVTNEIS